MEKDPTTAQKTGIVPSSEVHPTLDADEQARRDELVAKQSTALEHMSTEELLVGVTAALSKLLEKTLTSEDKDSVKADETWVYGTGNAAVARSVEDGWELLEYA